MKGWVTWLGVVLVSAACAAGGRGGSGGSPARFVAFQGGEFLMGAPADEPGRFGDEVMHGVTIGHGFMLQATEVTQAQWHAQMSTRPWRSACAVDACPVETVTWYEAAAFANARSRAEGLPACYRLTGCNGQRPGEGYACEGVESVGVACAGYRLPTEAEWEYAARGGGLRQRYPWGDGSATCDLAVMEDPLGDLGCGSGGPLPVCDRPAGHSAQGLCDMAGNVWEWAEDWYGPYREAPVDGRARQAATEARVIRGGAWDYGADNLRAATRDRSEPDYRGPDVGFRLARSIP